MTTKENLREFVRQKLSDHHFIVVSNRQPYEHVYNGGAIECRRPSGGVITALDSVMRACHGLWIAASSGEADHLVTDGSNKIEVPADGPSYTLKRVWLSKQEEEGYYYGYSNEALWPLCHTAFQRPVFNQSDWRHYVNVNRKFARAVMEEVGTAKAFIWIQDYHFCLLPKFLRDMSAPGQLIIAQFWHIPWPGHEAFRICPQKNEILEGLLANDMIGFHTHYHCNNFLEVVDRQMESKIDRERFSVVRKNHETLIRPYPISVDFEEINHKAWAGSFERDENDLNTEFTVGNKRLLLGVDRIDYTKGIPEKILAMDRLLDKHPELKEQIVFLQAGVLSRVHIAKYKDLNDEIDVLVEKVNRKHAVGEWKPVIFSRGHIPPSKLIALYRMADVCVVSPLHDGMNLVAKEFICAHCDEDGVLVLSQFAGCARELTEALLINPYDAEQSSESLYRALTMPADERRRRMLKMRQAVRGNDIFRWAKKFIAGLLKIEFQEEAVYQLAAAA